MLEQLLGGPKPPPTLDTLYSQNGSAAKAVSHFKNWLVPAPYPCPISSHVEGKGTHEAKWHTGKSKLTITKPKSDLPPRHCF